MAQVYSFTFLGTEHNAKKLLEGLNLSSSSALMQSSEARKQTCPRDVVCLYKFSAFFAVYRQNYCWCYLSLMITFSTRSVAWQLIDFRAY